MIYRIKSKWVRGLVAWLFVVLFIPALPVFVIWVGVNAVYHDVIDAWSSRSKLYPALRFSSEAS